MQLATARDEYNNNINKFSNNCMKENAMISTKSTLRITNRKKRKIEKNLHTIKTNFRAVAKTKKI